MSAPTAKHDLRAICANFQLYGAFREAAPYGSGHINDTYAAVYDQAGAPMRYVVQRINHNVFKNPVGLMQNVERICAHLAEKTAGHPDAARRRLTLVPAHDGRSYWVDGGGNHWRVYLFIEKAKTYDQIESSRQAYEAAKAFGEFQKQLADIPAPRLVDTIPGFHDTRMRFDTLRAAIQKDAHNRAAQVKKEIEFALAHESIVDVLLNEQKSGAIPERITHNDTKLNNVMIDDATSEGICCIDLDTAMPGLTLYDFGDMCRTATRPTAEDERDLSKVVPDLKMFEALVGGYLASAGSFLTKAEKNRLVFSCRLITFEIGIRFLADFLHGDIYFKIRRDAHNVDRCRTQFKMVEEFERAEPAMDRIVAQAR